MAIFAWWARYHRSQKVLSKWGRDAVVAIRSGAQVELLRLTPLSDEASGETIVFQPSAPLTEGTRRPAALNIAKVTDISQTPGLIHARHHLVHEKGFAWDAARRENCEPEWSTGLRFSHGDNVATILLDFQCNRAYLVERRAEVSMQPIATSLRTFLSGL